MGKVKTFKPKPVKRFVIDVLEYSDEFGGLSADDIYEALYFLESMKAYEVREESVK